MKLFVCDTYFTTRTTASSTFKMPIILFLIDTSASMNQRTYLGTTYLDVAKGAVEVFMKVKNEFTPMFTRRARGSFATLVEIDICCFGFLFLTAACSRPG